MKHEEEELSGETGSLAVVRKDVPGMSSQVPGATGTHDTGCGEEGGREKVLSRDGEQKGEPIREGDWGRETTQAAANVKRAKQGCHRQNGTYTRGLWLAPVPSPISILLSVCRVYNGTLSPPPPPWTVCQTTPTPCPITSKPPCHSSLNHLLEDHLAHLGLVLRS